MTTSYAQLSDTTTLVGLIQMCEYYLGLADTAISGDANLLLHFKRLLNTRYREAIAWCFEASGDWQYRGDNTATVNITAATRAYQLSANLTNFLRIIRIDIKYPSTATDYQKATQIDMAKVATGLDNYTTTNPQFDLIGDYFNIYVADKTANISAVTSGIKIYYDDDITSLSDVTDVAYIPVLFLQLLALGACIDYCIREELNNKLTILKNQQIETKADLMKFIANRSEAKRFGIRFGKTNYGEKTNDNYIDINNS